MEEIQIIPQKRRFLSCETIVLDYTDIHRESFRPKEPTIYEIHRDGVKYEFLIKWVPGCKQAVVFGTGDIGSTAQKYSYPIYSRGTWAYDIDINGIWYFDPTIYLGNITLGWGYGTDQRWYLEEISQILRIILKKLNISQKSLICSGSSGGGFTSMILASMLHCKAAVINPQFSIVDFWPHMLQKLKDAVLESGQELIHKRLRVVDCILDLGYFPQIYVKQNILTKHDLQTQLTPFLYELSQLKFNCENRLSVDFYNAEGANFGHNAMPSKAETMRWLQEKLDLPYSDMPLIKDFGYLISKEKLYFYLDNGNRIRNKADLRCEPRIIPGYSYSFRLLKSKEELEHRDYSSGPYCSFDLPAEGVYELVYSVHDGLKSDVFSVKGIEIKGDTGQRAFSEEEVAFAHYLDDNIQRYCSASSCRANTSYQVTNGKLRFSLDFVKHNPEFTGYTFAFYLMKDKTTIQKTGYMKASECEFDVPDNGEYAVKYYLNDGKNRRSYVVKNIQISDSNV